MKLSGSDERESWYWDLENEEALSRVPALVNNTEVV